MERAEWALESSRNIGHSLCVSKSSWSMHVVCMNTVMCEVEVCEGRVCVALVSKVEQVRMWHHGLGVDL
jgi:hypothetical protein